MNNFKFKYSVYSFYPYFLLCTRSTADSTSQLHMIMIIKPGARAGHGWRTPGFLKLFLCRRLCVRVCVCVSAPDAINN